jgi:hypothetical protein
MATAVKATQTDPTLDGLVTQKQLEAQFIFRCWQDAGFKKRLLADPRSTIEGELSLKLPSGMKVRVQEEAAHTLTFILPAAPPAGGELSDADLEQVAGGKGNLPTATTTASGQPYAGLGPIGAVSTVPAGPLPDA